MGPEPFRAAHPHAVLLNAPIEDVTAEPDFATSVVAGTRWSLIRALARSVVVPRTASGRTHGAEVTVVAKKRYNAFRKHITVGRGRSVDISFAWIKLSKNHGYFARGEDGTYTYTDAGSTNGTFIDGHRLDAQVAYPLWDKARIAFGPYCFIFYGPDAFCEFVAERAAAR